MMEQNTGMYTYFHCTEDAFSHEDNLDNYNTVTNEIELCSSLKQLPYTKNMRINNNIYECNIINNEADVLFNITRKLWRQLEDVILTESCNPNFDTLSARNHIIDFLACCRYAVITCESDTYKLAMIKRLTVNIELMKASMNPLHDLDDVALGKLLSVSIKCTETAVSTYFHTYFDVKWLILTIECVSKQSEDTLKDTFENLLKDIISVSYKYFLKLQAAKNTESHPFICICIKRLWVMLLKFSVNIGGIETFWEVYNNVLKLYQEEFAFWILYYIATLQCYNSEGVYVKKESDFSENISHVDQKLKALLTRGTETENETLTQCLHFLQPLLSDFWLRVTKIEPYQLLWDYFFKNLNAPYLKAPKNSVVLNEHIDRLKNGVLKSTYSSFDLFLNMLLVHLKQHPAHWGKLRGRIYSRLSANKLKDLNENGRYNISLLFLMLSNFNFEEMIGKLKDLLENFADDKRHAEQLWIVHMAMVTIHIQNGRKIDNQLASTLLILVEKASENRDQFSLIRLFVEGLDNITNISSDFSLNQGILFGRWMCKYMQCCQHSDLCFLLNTITWTAENTYRQGAWFEWASIFSNNILPGLKQVATSPSAPSQAGKLAALIAKNSPETLSQNLSYFSGENINNKVANQFLSVVLEDYPENRMITTAQEHVIIQAWIRFCLFSAESHDVISEKIINFEVFSCLNVQNPAREPLISLVKAIYEQLNNSTYTNQLKEICVICFGTIDKSIAHQLANSQSEAGILHIYTNVSYLFYHCSTLLYNKAKSNCLFSRLINILLLPTEVLMGRPPSPIILRSVEKTWHLFFCGIFKLNYESDPFLEKTLKDLVVRYLPFFQTNTSPFFKCLENPEHISFILDKLSTGFVSQSSKTSEENVFKALRSVQLIMEKSSSLSVVKLVVQRVLGGVLEVIMFQNQKVAALEIVKILAMSEFYVQIRDELRKTLLLVTEKHLAFSSNNYFQMAFALIKLIPLDMKEILPDLKKQIVIVERMRGVGFDNVLRQHLDRFTTTLAAQ